LAAISRLWAKCSNFVAGARSAVFHGFPALAHLDEDHAAMMSVYGVVALDTENCGTSRDIMGSFVESFSCERDIQTGAQEDARRTRQRDRLEGSPAAASQPGGHSVGARRRLRTSPKILVQRCDGIVVAMSFPPTCTVRDVKARILRATDCRLLNGPLVLQDDDLVVGLGIHPQATLRCVPFISGGGSNSSRQAAKVVDPRPGTSQQKSDHALRPKIADGSSQKAATAEPLSASPRPALVAASSTSCAEESQDRCCRAHGSARGHR